MATVTIPKVMANFTTSLAAKILSSDSSLTIARSTDDDGTTLSGLYSVTIDEGTSAEEHMQVTFSGVTGTITRRGLSRVDGWTEQAANKFDHENGAVVKITNFSLVNLQRLLKGTDTFEGVTWAGITQATIGGMVMSSAGITTCPAISGLSTPTSGETTKAANVAYVNASVAAGVNDASVTVKGIVEIGTQTEVNEGDDAGATTAPTVVIPSTHLGTWDLLVTTDYTYGDTIAAKSILYLDLTTAKWELALATAETTATGALGIAIDSGVDTDTGKRVQIGGVVTGLTGLTAGYQYLTDAGGLSTTAGTFRRMVGYAPNTTTLIMLPSTPPLTLEGANSSATLANFNEAMTLIANTDITGAQLETLSDGSNADALHVHDSLFEKSPTAGILKTNINISDGFNTGTADHTNRIIFTMIGTTKELYNSVGFVQLEGSNTGSGVTITTAVQPFDVITWDKDWTMELQAYLTATGSPNMDAFIGFGSDTCSTGGIDADATSTDRHIGFYWQDGTCYASNADGTTQTKTDISASFTYTVWNTYKIVNDAGTNIKFYVNNVLLATHTTNLPSGNNAGGGLAIGIVNQYTGVAKSMYVQNPFPFQIDLN